MTTDVFEALGLDRNPFSMAADTEGYFHTEVTKQTLDELAFGILSRKGFLLLTGEVGVGKTSLLYQLLRRLEDENLVTSWIFNTMLNKEELLGAIARDFGLDAPKSSNVAQLIDLLQTYLLEQNAAERNCAIIVDEAHNLSLPAMEALRMLSNLEVSGKKLVQILLVGQPELKERLDEQKLRQLRSRISIFKELLPFSLEETGRYVNFKLSSAASQFRLSGKPLKLLFEATEGNTRMTNLIMERALYAAVAFGDQDVSLRVMRAAIAEIASCQIEVAERMAKGGKRLRTLSVVAAVVIVLVGLFTPYVPANNTLESPASVIIHKISEMRSAAALKDAEEQAKAAAAAKVQAEMRAKAVEQAKVEAERAARDEAKLEEAKQQRLAAEKAAKEEQARLAQVEAEKQALAKAKAQAEAARQARLKAEKEAQAEKAAQAKAQAEAAKQARIQAEAQAKAEEAARVKAEAKAKAAKLARLKAEEEAAHAAETLTAAKGNENTQVTQVVKQNNRVTGNKKVFLTSDNKTEKSIRDTNVLQISPKREAVIRTFLKPYGLESMVPAFARAVEEKKIDMFEEVLPGGVQSLRLDRLPADKSIPFSAFPWKKIVHEEPTWLVLWKPPYKIKDFYYGYHHNNILTLQHQLKKLGYYWGPDDGLVGPLTWRAVNAFQKDMKLKRTMWPDASTIFWLHVMASRH